MNEILGYDIDGRPLRAGDRVVIAMSETRPELVGTETIVKGPAAHGWPNRVEIDVDPKGTALVVIARTYLLRRIDNNDTTTWDHVAEVTGWTPAGVPA